MENPIIIKNTLNEVVHITDLSNQYVGALEQKELSNYYTITEINSSQSLRTFINDGTIIINNGTIDLPIEDALNHVTDATNYELIKKLSDLPEVPPIEVGKIMEGVDSTSVIWIDKPDKERYLCFGISLEEYCPDTIVPTVPLTNTGYIMPTAGIINSIAVTTDASTSNEFEVLKNGGIVGSLSFDEETKKTINDLNVSYVKDDIINLQTTSTIPHADINNVYTPDDNTLWLAHIDGDSQTLKHITNSSTISKGMSGRVIGATLNSTGIFDKCISFDGTDYVQLLHHDDYDTQDCTIEFSIKPTNLLDWQTFLSKEDSNLGLFIGSNGSKLNLTNGTFEWESSSLFTTGIWQHIAIVLGIGGLKIFLDGTLIHSDAGHTLGLNGNYELMTLGTSLEYNTVNYYNTFDYYYTGQMDELRISNSRRYETNFTTPSAEFTNDVNTVGLWHFNETSGFLVYDESDTIQNAMLMANNSLSEIKTDQKKFGTHSLKLNGSNDDWIRSNHLPVYESTTITVEGWIRPHHDTSTGIVFQKGDSNTEGGLTVMWVKDVKRLDITYEGASTSRTLQTNNNSFIRNEWHHFSITLSATQIVVLVDAAVQDYEDLTTDYENVWLNNKSDIYWGRNGIVNSYYGRVYLDESRISNIHRIYSGETSGIKQITALVGVK
jgi:hypothetical protein